MKKQKYKDIKLSTLLKKVEEYIKSQQLNDIPSRDFDRELDRHFNDYLSQHNYPIRFDNGDRLISTEIEALADEMSDLNASFDVRERAMLCELTIRWSWCKRLKTKSFKSIVKTGPYYNMKISELIERRKNGFSYYGDSVDREIHLAGYASAKEMIESYDMAKKTEEKLRWIKFHYEKLSEQEKLLREQT